MHPVARGVGEGCGMSVGAQVGGRWRGERGWGSKGVWMDGGMG